ncbi:MAG TPA: EstA family serine hydrolase [Spirochaetaceae bacterium]|nr:EstA family serine hydrolase [Spirochaetaceae bacterium]
MKRTSRVTIAITTIAATVMALGGCQSAPQGGSLVSGWVAPGFEGVREEFERNFAERGESGAACAVYWKGEKVVDLWGGYRDVKAKDPWQEDTMVLVFSATKGMAAMTFAHAASRGLIDYEERVAAYWPEFAEAGKKAITVRQLLAHEAGLVLLDEALPADRVMDHEFASALLARQKPYWTPGERHGYHSSTIGLYMAELLRRVDPAGRSIGRYFAEEIAAPLGLDFYIGLPGDIPDSRIARLIMASPAGGMFNLGKLPKGMRAKMLDFNSYIMKSFGIPKGYDPTSREGWTIELAAGNGIGTARSMARAYGEFATGGKTLGIGADTIALLEAPPATPPAGSLDEVMGFDSWYSLGYMRPGPRLSFGSSPKAYGTAGAGGNFAFADPDAQLGFAYQMTKMGYYASDDPREKSLRDAVYAAIRSQGGL